MTVRQFRRLEIGLIWWIGNPNTVMVWYPRYFGSQIRRLRHQGSAGILREYSSAGTEFNGQTLTCRKDCSRIPISSRNFFLARKTIIPKHPAGRQTTDHCVTFPMLGSKCGRRALNCEMVTSRHGQNGHESRLGHDFFVIFLMLKSRDQVVTRDHFCPCLLLDVHNDYIGDNEDNGVLRSLTVYDTLWK